MALIDKLVNLIKLKNETVSEDIICNIIEMVVSDNNLIECFERAKEVDENIKIKTFVFETKNTSNINLLSGNRKPDEKNINKIIESISKNGYRVSQPITLDENLSIIDGQHRKLACEKMNLPVYFTIEEQINDSLKLTQDLNRNQKNWGLLDYIKSYADMGNNNYSRFLNFVENENVSISLTIWLLYHSRNGEIQSRIKNGDLKFSGSDSSRIKVILDKIRQIKNVIPNNLTAGKAIRNSIESDKVAMPLITIMSESNYSHRRMLKQMETLYHSLDRRNMSSAGESLVEIYNHKLGKMKRLRTYNEMSQ